MALTNFIKFFNERGEDTNFISATGSLGVNYTGMLFFPRVSVNLIESKQLYFLEEITAGWTSTDRQPYLRKISGSVDVIATNPFIQGDADFESIVVGDTVRIAGVERTVNAVSSMGITVSSGINFTGTTEDFYLVDNLWYNKPFRSTDVLKEEIIAEFQNEEGPFFFYDINFDENVPLISKTRTFTTELQSGSTVQDLLTGRMIVNAAQSDVSPIQSNIGFSTSDEGVYEELVTFSLRKEILFNFDSLPVKNSDGTWDITLSASGYLEEFRALDKIYLSIQYGSKFQNHALDLIEVSEPSLITLKVKEVSTSLLSTAAASNVADFHIRLIWKEPLLYLNLYGEAEGEDERFRLTLENFGRKIDEENEYIFRESNINEDLTDYVLLNQKRKEMLLEGDKIFPYMGSYKALINILNLFGYYDMEIKEYFLNVDSTSPDKGKFLKVPITKSSEQKKIIKKVWDLLPSKIYKKTSLFGLYYKLNKESGDYDDFGIPLVTEDYQFSPEEVLIKLFGLKELLKKEYLPLNARIYDITGEGIYFERLNFTTWSDSVDVRVLDIGKRPQVDVFPKPSSYIRDVRRIDQFYVDKFTKLGYSGFLGEAATAPDMIVFDAGLGGFIATGNLKQPVDLATTGIENYVVSGGQVVSIDTTQLTDISTWKLAAPTGATVSPVFGYFFLNDIWSNPTTTLSVHDYSFYLNRDFGGSLESIQPGDIIRIVGATDSSAYKYLEVVSSSSNGSGYERFTVNELTTGPSTGSEEMDFRISFTRQITSIDSLSPIVGNRLLIKNAPVSSGIGSTSETSSPANGLYEITAVGASISIVRSADANASGEITPGFIISILSGSQNQDTLFQLGNTASVSLNTTPLNFVKTTAEEAFSGLYVYPDYIPSYPDPAVSELFNYYVGSFNDYNMGKWSYRDFTWDTMPPGISDPDFNVKASYYKPLPDDSDGTYPMGAPALIETVFALMWDECDFSWDQCSTLTTFPGSYSISGYTVQVSDLFGIDIDSRGLTAGDTVTIANCPFAGNYIITGITGSSFTFDIQYEAAFLTGQLTYSFDIAQVSSTINRLSWDTIGRGEYVDMRVYVEKYGETTFLYDSGRKPIDEFAVPYYDKTIGLTYNRLLDAVLLPYEGEYNVFFYIYDITNNFTMQNTVYKAITPTAEITASFQKQEIYDNWDDMKSITWFDATFDWYYPSRSLSRWDEADLQWDSLEAYSYRFQDLKENKVSFRILEVDREKQSIKINGPQEDYLYIVPGNFMYFERKSNKLEFENYSIAIGDLGLTGPGSDAGSSTTSIDLSSLAIGATLSVTLNSNSLPYETGDRVIVYRDSSNYFTASVNSYVAYDLTLTVESIAGSGSYSTWGTNQYGGYFYLSNCTEDKIVQHGRLVLKANDTPFYGLTASNFCYADVLEINGSSVRLFGIEQYVNTFLNLSQTQELYLDGGVYAGTYSIEIKSVKASGSDTIIYLNDAQKELYKLDGYFTPFLTSYDVDYAETHIGRDANDYNSMWDVDWDNLQEKSWWSQERHPATNSGFVITEVAAGGKITIGDYDTFIFSGDTALNDPEVNSLSYACRELNASTNDGISLFEYELFPNWQLNVKNIEGKDLIVATDVPMGATSIPLAPSIGGTVSIPSTLRVPAVLNIDGSGGTVTASVVQTGAGYDRPPIVTILGPTGATGAVIQTEVDIYGRVIAANVISDGSGYDSSTTYEIDNPVGFEDKMTNMVWTGNEWHKVIGVNDNVLYIENPTVYAIEYFYRPCVPYRYHQQIFNMDPKRLKDFYFFIVAKSKTPSLSSLLSVEFDDGVEGEWFDHPQRSYSLPLKNTLLFEMQNKDLSQDAQYQYWKYNGYDFPVSGFSDTESQALYAGSYYEPFSYSDAVITPYSFEIERSTSVLFHDDSTRLPTKKSRVWKIVNEETGEVEVEASSNKLWWNFSKNGKFTVSLEVTDSRGNMSRGTKKSFVIVK